MSLPFPFPSPAALAARASCDVLNAMLAREPWAQARLLPYAGKTVRVRSGGLSWSVTVEAGGRLRAADRDAVAQVTLTVAPADVWRLPAALAAGDEAAVQALLHVEGEAALAQVVSSLARDLRWDAEDALAQRVGDVAARRLVRMGSGLWQGGREAAWRLAENGAEYAAHEAHWVLNRARFDDWRDDLQDMLARLDAVEARWTVQAPTAGRR